jgi:hypothetical protein
VAFAETYPILIPTLGDEGKPACLNCTSRNAECRYADWTFVSEGPFGSATSDDAQEDSPDAVQHTAEALAFTPLPTGSAISSYRVQNGDLIPNQLPSPPIVPSPCLVAETTAGAPQSLDENVHIPSWTSVHAGDDFIYEATTPSRWINGNLSQQGSMSARSALLRFRYQVVPWIDSNNCKSTFGPTMMTLARGNKVISDCIIYCMRLRDESGGTATAETYDSSTRARLLDELAQEGALTADIGRAILALSDIFCTPPSEWAKVSAPPVRCYGGEAPQSRAFGFVTEPLKTLMRLQLKIGEYLESLVCQGC